MYNIPQLTVRKSALVKACSTGGAESKSKNGLRIVDKLEARYELYLTPDLGIGKKPNKDGEYVKFGMSKHTQWFYFSTKNFSSRLRAHFAIKNLYKKNSAYSKGMQPFVFSLRKYKETGIGWYRG